MKLIKNFKAIFLASSILASAAASASEELAGKNLCLACHQVDTKVVGPSFREVAEKYAGDSSAVETLSAKVKNGGSGVWGQIPMPPNPQVSDEDIHAIVEWILSL